MPADLTTLSIGPLTAVIATDDLDVGALVRSRYAAFLTAALPAWRFEIARSIDGVRAGVDVAVHGDGAQLVLERHDFRATMDLDARTARVALGAVDAIALDAFLRVAWSVALLDHQALLVHASSVMRGGRGYAFPGVSGAGKTTIARLSPGATLLSDELSILLVAGDGGRCYGTPFWGELERAGEPTEAALAGVYFPRKASHHAVRPLRPRAAVPALLGNVVFFATAPELRARAFAIAADLSERVPAFELGFRRDPGFWELIGRA